MDKAIHKILRTAILGKRCVTLTAQGWQRILCPHALGYINKRATLLAFQYGGSSTSGLPPAGGWRSIPLDDILGAEVTDGEWRSSGDYIVKLETSFDYIEIQARPLHRGELAL